VSEAAETTFGWDVGFAVVCHACLAHGPRRDSESKAIQAWNESRLVTERDNLRGELAEKTESLGVLQDSLHDAIRERTSLRAQLSQLRAVVLQTNGAEFEVHQAFTRAMAVIASRVFESGDGHLRRLLTSLLAEPARRDDLFSQVFCVPLVTLSNNQRLPAFFRMTEQKTAPVAGLSVELDPFNQDPDQAPEESKIDFF